MRFILFLLIPLFATCSFQYADEAPTLDPIEENEQTTPHMGSIEEVTLSYEQTFVKTLGVLAIMLIAVLVIFWLIKRFSNNRMQQINFVRNIKILEKRPISPKSILYLIEIGGKQILIAESQLEIRPISDLTWIKNTKEGL